MTAAVVDKPTVLLFKRQMRFVKDARSYPAYIGGIGSGKSFAGAAKVVSRLSRSELGMIAAPTYPMLRDATRRALTEMLDTFGIEYELHKTENTIAILRSGHEILCRSLDNPDTLRGPNLAYAWIDEGAMTDRQGWQIVKGRVRDGDNPQAWITSTPKGRNYVWEEWERDATGTEADPTHPLYRVRTTENYHLPEGWAEGLGYTDEFYAQEIAGEFVSFEGLVYAAFNRARVQRLDCDGWRTILGVDVGARNPTAVLTLRIRGDGHVHIERERYQRNLDSDEITDAIIEAMASSGASAAYCDPSAKAYIDSWQKRSLRVKPANNDVTRGIGIVKAAIADGLTVDPSCVNTIAEFESYVWADGEKDVPIKQGDHCLIAGTMVRTEYGEKPIETINAGERVWTRQGLQPVIAAGLTNPSVQVYTLRTADGRTLTGSSDHPVWTANRGWVFLDSLRYYDILSVWQSESISSPTTALHSGAIPMRLGIRTGAITFPVGSIASVALAGCMRKSGRQRTGLSLPAARFITSTAIRSITSLSIWRALTLPSIGPITRRFVRCIPSNLNGSPLTGPRLLSGTDPTKAGAGTANTARPHGRHDNRWPVSAISVVLALSPSLTGLATASARTSARAHGGAHRDSTTNCANVRHAARRSPSISTTNNNAALVSVRSVTANSERQPVYNLTIANVPEFYANGILVHNSMDALRYALVGEAAPKRTVAIL